MFCVPSFDEMTNLTPYFNHVIPAYAGIQTASHSASQVEELYETGSTMDRINGMTPEKRGFITRDFKKAMRATFRIFDDDAFRTRYRQDDKRRSINRALFETWSVQLAHCSLDQIDQLVHCKKRLCYRFRQLLREDVEFDVGSGHIAFYWGP